MYIFSITSLSFNVARNVNSSIVACHSLLSLSFFYLELCTQTLTFNCFIRNHIGIVFKKRELIGKDLLMSDFSINSWLAVNVLLGGYV